MMISRLFVNRRITRVIPRADLVLRNDRKRRGRLVEADDDGSRLQLPQDGFDFDVERRIGMPLHRPVARDEVFDQRLQGFSTKLLMGNDNHDLLSAADARRIPASGDRVQCAPFKTGET